MSRRSAIAIACGAVLFGWSLGSVTSVDRELQAAVATPVPTVGDGLVAEHTHDCGHHGHRL